MQFAILATTALMALASAQTGKQPHQEFGGDDLAGDCYNNWSCQNIVGAGQACQSLGPPGTDLFSDPSWVKCACSKLSAATLEDCVRCNAKYGMTTGDVADLEQTCANRQ